MERSHQRKTPAIAGVLVTAQGQLKQPLFDVAILDQIPVGVPGGMADQRQGDGQAEIESDQADPGLQMRKSCNNNKGAPQSPSRMG
jgi:hypothetical protein